MVYDLVSVVMREGGLVGWLERGEEERRGKERKGKERRRGEGLLFAGTSVVYMYGHVAV